jgi:hypothetical protein
MQNPARDLLEDETGGAQIDRMTGIRPALVPHDPVGTLGQYVDQLPLPFISPLGADDDDSPGLGVEHDR